MKAILEFDLPDDEASHRLAIEGEQWYYAAVQFSRWLRNTDKHVELDEVYGCASEYHDVVARIFHAIIAEQGVEFHE